MSVVITPAVTYLHKTTSQSIPNTTWTNINFDFATTDGLNPTFYTQLTSIYTAAQTGIYKIQGTFTWPLAAAGSGAIRLLINSDTTRPQAIFTLPFSATLPTTNTLDYTVNLNNGDTLVLQVYQNSGGPLVCPAGINLTGDTGAPNPSIYGMYEFVRSNTL